MVPCLASENCVASCARRNASSLTSSLRLRCSWRSRRRPRKDEADLVSAGFLVWVGVVLDVSAFSSPSELFWYSSRSTFSCCRFSSSCMRHRADRGVESPTSNTHTTLPCGVFCIRSDPANDAVEADRCRAGFPPTFPPRFKSSFFPLPPPRWRLAWEPPQASCERWRERSPWDRERRFGCAPAALPAAGVWYSVECSALRWPASEAGEASGSGWRLRRVAVSARRSLAFCKAVFLRFTSSMIWFRAASAEAELATLEVVVAKDMGVAHGSSYGGLSDGPGDTLHDWLVMLGSDGDGAMTLGLEVEVEVEVAVGSGKRGTEGREERVLVERKERVWDEEEVVEEAMELREVRREEENPWRTLGFRKPRRDITEWVRRSTGGF